MAGCTRFRRYPSQEQSALGCEESTEVYPVDDEEGERSAGEATGEISARQEYFPGGATEAQPASAPVVNVRYYYYYNNIMYLVMVMVDSLLAPGLHCVVS